MNNNRDYQEWLFNVRSTLNKGYPDIDHIPDDTQLIYGETIVLNGYVYDVIVEEHSNGKVTVEHIPIEDSCSDGEIPF